MKNIAVFVAAVMYCSALCFAMDQHNYMDEVIIKINKKSHQQIIPRILK